MSDADAIIEGIVPEYHEHAADAYKDELALRNGVLFKYYAYFLLAISGVGALTRILMRGGDLFWPFFIMFALYALIGLAHKQILRVSKNTTVAVYAVQIPAWIIGILLGSVLDPNNRTMTFFLFVALMPLFILDKPQRVVAYNFSWHVAFALIAWIVKPWEIFRIDMSFLTMFSIAALTTSSLILMERLNALNLFVESQRAARTDSLTGLLNRYALTCDTERYLGREFIMGIARIDDLSFFTDVYGHNTSDEILRHWTRATASFFPYENCYCYTNHEILLVMPAESPEAFEHAVSASQQAFFDSVSESLHIRPSVSVGYVNGTATDGDDLEQMINHADILLHEAQYAGGSQVRGGTYDRSAVDPGAPSKQLGYHIESHATDALTGLANMQAFTVRAKNLLSDLISKYGNGEIVLIYFDIENFKTYNEDFGRQKGDDLLRSVAEVLTHSFKDRLIGRYGDDHFVVMCYEDEYEECLAQVLNATFDLHNRSNMPLKAGVYLYRDHAEDISVACDRAKTACDSVKSRYDVFWRIYDEDLRSAEERRSYVIAHVDEAIANGWLRVYYQPIIDIATKSVVECEALIRWIDPEYGFMPPFAFIEVLEHARLVYKIDLWVAEQACIDYQQRVQSGLSPLPVSINLSRSDFQQCDIEHELLALTDRYGVPRHHLHVEVTESALSDDFAQLVGTTNRLRSYGFELWLDDFGSDYSSLTTLKDFPCDVIKLDMMFLRDSDGNERARVVIEQAVQLAKRLGALCLCEGVEDQHHLDFLTSIGCDLAQGYLFSKPEPLETLMEKGLIP